jgi:hypothetical protein
MRKSRTCKFFRKIRCKKGTNQNIGKNTLAKFPSERAKSLGRDKFEEYTGHCFGRTGATILADSGVDKLTLKRAGRWKSDSVCEGYIEESKDSKLNISKIISHKETESLHRENLQQKIATTINNISISGADLSHSVEVNILKDQKND